MGKHIVFIDPNIPEEELKHYGVLGMKWGKRKSYDKTENRQSFLNTISTNKNKKIIKTSTDNIIPRGFNFNRVGGSNVDFNESGGLYVSHGKQDAARYIKNLGPSLIGTVFKSGHKNIQHISAKKNMKIPNDSTANKLLMDFAKNNDKLLDTLNNSLMLSLYTNDLTKSITKKDMDDIIALGPKSDKYKKMAYTISSIFGDKENASITKDFYNELRGKKYDAFPDLFDVNNGTSTSAMIIINPDAISINSIKTISKIDYKEVKSYVKTLEKLPMSSFTN